MKKFLDIQELLDFKNAWEADKLEDEEQFVVNACGKHQKTIWDLFDKPHTSWGAKAVAITSSLAILVSTIILTLNTLPEFSTEDGSDFLPFAIMEGIINIWFTTEFFVRLVSCPDKLKFVKQIMNWVDLLAILPYYVGLLITIYTEQVIAQETAMFDENGALVTYNTHDEVETVAKFFKLLRIVKIARSIRIFKLARHFEGLQALGYTFKSKKNEFGLLLMFLTMGAFSFSSLIYLAEKDSGGTIEDMTDAYWWSFITMTTVGYGDTTPVTNWGRFIGCWCAIFGVLVIGLPIPVIVKSFNKFYTVVKKKNNSVLVKEKSKKMSRAQAPSTTEENNTVDPSMLPTRNTPVFSMSENEEAETKERSWRARKSRRQKISHSS